MSGTVANLLRVRGGKRKSVLIVSNVYPPEVYGGAELVAHRQALALADIGFKVSVFTGTSFWKLGNKKNLIPDKVDGIDVFRIATQHVTVGESHYRPEVEEQFCKVLDLLQPDAVHFHNLPGLGAGLIPLSKSFGATVLVTLHDTWGFCLRQTRLRDGGVLCTDPAECDLCLAWVPGKSGERLPIRYRRDYVRWCLEHADRLLFPSDSLLQSYAAAGLPSSRFVIARNGVDLAVFRARHRKPNGHVAFLAASALEEHKGVAVLWDALGILLSDRELDGRWSMVLAGDGKLAPRLRERFRSGALRKPVSKVGFVPQQKMQAVYDRADVVVLASICPENQPLTILEGAVSGMALLGTEIGGIPELIDDEQGGYLVPPGEPKALAAAMRKMILQPALVEEFSRYNMMRRERFDHKDSIALLADLISASAKTDGPLRRPLVICSGKIDDVSSGSAMSHGLRMLDDNIRLIWSDWIPSRMDIQPDILCIFGDDFPAGALGRALIEGIPVVSPRTLSLDTVPGFRKLVYNYDTELDALTVLSRLGAEIEPRKPKQSSTLN